MNTRTPRRYKSDIDRAIYGGIKANPPLIVRVDGRDFKRVLHEHNFKKPYDERFAQGMAEAAVAFFEKSGFDPVLVYLFSDELSILFKYVPFNGRVEKLASVIPSFIASALTRILEFKDAIAFDARIMPVCGGADVLEYLVQRQAEAWRNHINAYGYYGLIEGGLSIKEAEREMIGLKAGAVHELLFRMGLNLNETPKWQRRGIIVTKRGYEKQGYDPKTTRYVTSERYKVVQLWDLPLFKSEEGQKFISELTAG